jgi:hypothetical protein
VSGQPVNPGNSASMAQGLLLHYTGLTLDDKAAAE